MLRFKRSVSLTCCGTFTIVFTFRFSRMPIVARVFDRGKIIKNNQMIFAYKLRYMITIHIFEDFLSINDKYAKVPGRILTKH